MVKFLIVASGLNCKEYAGKCIKSVVAQRYGNFKAVFISDGSTDGTLSDIGRTHHNCCFIERYDKNVGAAKRRLDAIRKYSDSPDDVILFLGLDDELLPNCLEVVAKQYVAGKWMTYGNWKNQHGKVPLNAAFLQFDEATHTARDYRKVKYRSTAPNTFRRFLFDRIPEEDFKVNGKWIDSTTESEVMFSCLEMCGKEKIGVINEPIYLYNEGLAGGTIKRLGVKYKYDILAQIIQRPKKAPYESR
jgi:glycosyltransferase involved in cell wall biosynthesis